MPTYNPVVGKVLQTNIGKISYASTFSPVEYDGSDKTLLVPPQHIGTNLLPLLVGHETINVVKTITDAQYGDISLVMSQWLTTSTVGGDVVYTGAVQIGYRYKGSYTLGISVPSTVRMTHLGYAVWYNENTREICAGYYIESLKNDNTKDNYFFIDTLYTNYFNPEIKGLMAKLLIDELVSLNSYKPLYNLHSSNQIFTLTTIGKTPNDGSEVVLAPSEDIISWSEQSRLRDYIINLRESNRFAKIFTLNEHKYIGIKVNSYTVDGGLGYWDCTIGFYIDGVRQESLNLPILANTITDINNSWGFYFAISVDNENGACLPTIVYKDVTTGNVSYQREGYSDVNGLYEYLSPFFGATIDPENPDIPLVDPTPTTDGQTGGGGTWSSPDFPVPVPDLPSTGVTECGFMSLYKMTKTQLNALARYLWSDDFLDEVKKFFSDPMQMIISCKMLPYTVSASSTTETIQAGNVSTTCTGYKIYGNNQYTKIDCGEILLPERTKTYLDYSPYRSAQIFLPFIGMRPIDVDTCVGHKIGVKYNCDCLTGQSVCFVTIDGNVAYTYECNIGMDIPISSESYQGIMGALTSALNVPLSVGTAIATGGMSVPLSGASLVSSAVGMANGSRPTIERSGSVSGVGGFLNHRQPFLILEYTDPVQAKNQKHFMGAPTNKNVVLKTCKGLTTVEQIYLNVLEATEEEKNEILDLLKGGVLI